MWPASVFNVVFEKRDTQRLCHLCVRQKQNGGGTNFFRFRVRHATKFHAESEIGETIRVTFWLVVFGVARASCAYAMENVISVLLAPGMEMALAP